MNDSSTWALAQGASWWVNQCWASLAGFVIADAHIGFKPEREHAGANGLLHVQQHIEAGIRQFAPDSAHAGEPVDLSYTTNSTPESPASKLCSPLPIIQVMRAFGHWRCNARTVGTRLHTSPNAERRKMAIWFG